MATVELLKRTQTLEPDTVDENNRENGWALDNLPPSRLSTLKITFRQAEKGLLSTGGDSNKTLRRSDRPIPRQTIRASKEL